jgi:N-acetylglucosamine-6-sulfatase
VSAIAGKVESRVNTGGKTGLSGRTVLEKTAVLFVVLAIMMVPAAGCLSKKAEAPERPNIILVLTDDQDASTLPYMPYVAGEFQASATTFPNATYNFSLCCPSRVSILRGQYTHNHRVWENVEPEGGYERFVEVGDDNSHVARWLDQESYNTGMFGLYLNGYVPVEDGPKPEGWDRFVLRGHIYSGGHQSPKAYKDEVIKDNAIRWLKERLPGRRPVFAWISFEAPHFPYEFDPRYADRFTEAPVPKPPSFNEKDVSDKPGYVADRPRLTDEGVRQLEGSYRDRLRGLLTPDDALRSIVEVVNAEGELDNTYIVFWTDNGYMMGQHRLLGKRDAYLESISFPMIVRGPGVRRGASDPRIVMNQDLAPTFAQMGTTDVPAFVDGRSMLPILDGTGPWRDVGLIEAPEPPSGLQDGTRPPSYRGLRAEAYTYVEYATGEHEYYDLRTDPHQLTNAYASLDQTRKDALHEKTRALAECAEAECRSLEERAP